MLVEDDSGVRSLLGFVLLREGWKVAAAADGMDAIAQLEQALPDVILLDMTMPGLDGWDVLARRAAEPTWRHVPVIVMSANHLHAKAVLDLGATSFLPKPFSIDQLRQALLEGLPPAESRRDLQSANRVAGDREAIAQGDGTPGEVPG